MIGGLVSDGGSSSLWINSRYEIDEGEKMKM